MPEISVIIPVFNSASYIHRCLETLKQQTFTDWEAICVNDGSTDSSGKLLDSMAQSDRRIRVVHKENQGVSAARNDGVVLSEGSYLTFLDSDDFLHPRALEIAFKAAEKEKADLAVYTYDRSYRVKTLIRNMLHIPEKREPQFKSFLNHDQEYLVTEDIFRYATEYSKPNMPAEELRWAVKHCQPWRGLYKRELIKDLKFPHGIIYEDFPWWSEVLLKVRKTVIINLPLYFYYPNRRSFIMSSNQAYRIESLEKAITLAKKLYEGEADNYKKEMWTKNFLIPFERKLESKRRKHHR